MNCPVLFRCLGLPEPNEIVDDVEYRGRHATCRSLTVLHAGRCTTQGKRTRQTVCYGNGEGIMNVKPDNEFSQNLSGSRAKLSAPREILGVSNSYSTIRQCRGGFVKDVSAVGKEGNDQFDEEANTSQLRSKALLHLPTPPLLSHEYGSNSTARWCVQAVNSHKACFVRLNAGRGCCTH